MVDSVVSFRNQDNRKKKKKVYEQHTDTVTGRVYKNTYIADLSFDHDAQLIINGNNMDTNLIQQEIDEAIAAFEEGGDPLHEEVSPNNFQKTTPLYQTWDALAAASTIPFLESTDQSDLVSIQFTRRISGNDKTRIWGMSNQEVSDVNSATQVAIDTQATLDKYAPFFEDRVKL